MSAISLLQNTAWVAINHKPILMLCMLINDLVNQVDSLVLVPTPGLDEDDEKRESGKFLDLSLCI